MKRIALLFAILPALAFAQGLPVKSGSSTDLWDINTNKAGQTTMGKSARATYSATATGLTTTALYNLSIEAGTTKTVRLVGWCVGVSNATAAALVTVTVQRRTTASSGGTAATAEGTASPAVSKFDPSDANFSGTVRVTGTLGTAGAVLDGVGFMVGELGAGAADPPSMSPFCRYYAQAGEKGIVIAAGTANGISINVTAPGAGGLASGSISALFMEE